MLEGPAVLSFVLNTIGANVTEIAWVLTTFVKV